MQTRIDAHDYRLMVEAIATKGGVAIEHREVPADMSPTRAAHGLARLIAAHHHQFKADVIDDMRTLDGWRFPEHALRVWTLHGEEVVVWLGNDRDLMDAVGEAAIP